MAGHPVDRSPPPTLSACPPSLDRIRLHKAHGPETYTLAIALDPDYPHDHLPRAIWYALGDVFTAATCEGNRSISLVPDVPLNKENTLQVLRNLVGNDSDGHFTVTRSWWYQSYNIYAYGNPTATQIDNNPQNDQSDANPALIQRPSQSTFPTPPEPFYERYIPHLESYFCMSIFGNSDLDIDLLHSWLNDPRVDQFWKDAGSRDDHLKWLKLRYDDPHVLPVLGSYRVTKNGDRSIFEPFAYYEIYWAAEDKIASFYSSEPYDRGIHMLVGSSNHRGPHRVKSWLPSLIHYIFNDQPLTQRVISEPNHQNLKMIQYLESFGFKKVDEVDVGHKIAAIMILDKSEFWKICPL